jgi:hypothetical protein
MLPQLTGQCGEVNPYNTRIAPMKKHSGTKKVIYKLILKKKKKKKCKQDVILLDRTN